MDHETASRHLSDLLDPTGSREPRSPVWQHVSGCNECQDVLATMNQEEIAARLEQLRKDLGAAQSGGDERIVKSLQDAVATADLRLDNFDRARKNAQFVAIELDRIEGKIQTLAKLGAPRTAPRTRSAEAR